MIYPHPNRYGDRKAYLGTPDEIYEKNPNDTENLHFPGFSPEAARWLVENRQVPKSEVQPRG